MHTIQDKVGIANCGNLCISSIPFVSFFLEFSVVVFITSVSKLSPINVGVMFPFSFSSRCNIYLSVSGCGIFPVRYFTLCCFFLMLSAGYISVVFGCGTLPVRYLALSCLFCICFVRNVSVVFGCGTFALRYLTDSSTPNSERLRT